ncbi:MAG: phosphoribosylformylglycinamidine cyclo-ligase [Deltaproteobacteria bacterium]|nr:phosphoribosylformylglycinamidine cyclo-ligase [Deltaproteobacteria bacterium]MBW2658983.1 phosphoribosylformylglycinamidine cyclo-ligase [Deltaproteobacteria bacterium]
MRDPKQSKYSEAGVDIDKGNKFIDEIRDIVNSTRKRGVLGEIGGFSSHMVIDTNRYEKPVIVNSTDGVGTKLAVAHLCNKHDTIGIDLVAMCVNDLIVGGAVPLSFLDYIAMGRLDVAIAKEIVTGIAAGCIQANCSLTGGETAEMPGLYQGKDYDIAGFVTGIVDRDEIIDGSDIRPGNLIIGLQSSGLHSNGYSLVRKICFSDHNLTVDQFIDEFNCTLGEELLRPTKIYVQSILNVLKNYRINGMVHNTGGGFIDNIPRILPKGCRAVIDTRTWNPQPVFSFLQRMGEIPSEEMYRTFNMGIGLLVITDEEKAADIKHHFEALGEKPNIIGEVLPAADDEQNLVDLVSDRRKN